MNNRNGKLIFGMLALLLIVGGVLFINSNKDSAQNIDEMRKLDLEPKENEIQVKGTIVCLPFSDNTVPDESTCAKSIKSEEKIYAIDSLDIGRPEDDLDIGTKVTAVGQLEPSAINDESKVFKYDGVLKVRDMEPEKEQAS